MKDEPFESLDRPADRETLSAAFRNWAAEWTNARILERFQELPEDILNVKVWRLAARATKTFGAVAEIITKAGEGTAALEDCLDRISEAFGGSESDFVEVEEQLNILGSFILTASTREEARAYLAASEITDDREIENLRDRVALMINEANSDPNEKVNREFGYAWDRFRREYRAYFVGCHNKVMNSPERKAKLSETLKSEDWAEFDILSKLPGFDRRFAAIASKYRLELADLECTIDPGPLLEHQPYCNCRFSLSESAQAELLPAALNDNLRSGLASFRRVLSENGEELARSIEKFIESSNDADLEAAGRSVAAALRSGREVPRFDDLQLKLLVEVLSETSETPIKRGKASGRVSSATQTPPHIRETIKTTLPGDQILLNV